MLSKVSIALAWLLLAIDVALGGILFAMPERSVGGFAWSTTPLVTMTIGAWFLGNAWAAAVVVRRLRWHLVSTVLLYLDLFGILQGAMAWLSRDALRFAGRPIAWLYAASIGASCLLAASSAVDWTRMAQDKDKPTASIDQHSALVTLIFVALVGLLGGYGMSFGAEDPTLPPALFPDALGAAGIRAFGAYYAALAISALPLAFLRRRALFQTHAFALFGLLIMSTAAAAVYADNWHFVEQPAQLAYPAAHVLLGLVVGALLLRFGTGSRQEPGHR
ncbi:MAG TPA: hypothetical protein VMU33_09375 [Burkholderiaceae bacterium]|nr:hypothetical protein [Burkholderiaceae bacterium]